MVNKSYTSPQTCNDWAMYLPHSWNQDGSKTADHHPNMNAIDLFLSIRVMGKDLQSVGNTDGSRLQIITHYRSSSGDVLVPTNPEKSGFQIIAH